MKNITKLEGKEYTSALTGESYDICEACQKELPHGFTIDAFGTPFAFDSCGNLFTENVRKEICFWDHETDELTVIAKDWIEFEAGCAEPKPVTLKEEQVKSVWIDPSFAKKMGVPLPKENWAKRLTRALKQRLRRA